MRTKRGFTLLELLVCTALISTLGLCVLPMLHQPDFSAETFVLKALMQQSEAMAARSEKHVWVNGFELRYNAYGNVSQAKTIVFDKSEITAQLGWGRLVQK